MYERVAESKDHDKNLLVLPATRATALYGEDRAHYDQAVLDFFSSYLPVAHRAPNRPGKREGSAASPERAKSGG